MSIENNIEVLNSNFNKASYSVKEIQIIIKVSRQMVYKLIKQNCFKAIKTEEGYRILKDSFDQWLDGEES